MKNFVTLIFALIFSLASFAAIEPVNRSNILKYDGSLDSNSLEQEFINVLNKSGGSLAIGSIVILDVSNDDGGSITTTTTAGQVPMCMMAVTCAANKLCKCQTYGFFDGALFDVGGGNAVAGKPFYISESNAGYIATIASPDAGDIPAGVYYDAASASGSVEVFLKMK
jgi:hypothetical protein